MRDLKLTEGDHLTLARPLRAVRPGQEVEVVLPDGSLALVRVESQARWTQGLGLFWAGLDSAPRSREDLEGILDALVNEAVDRVLGGTR